MKLFRIANTLREPTTTPSVTDQLHPSQTFVKTPVSGTRILSSIKFTSFLYHSSLPIKVTLEGYEVYLMVGRTLFNRTSVQDVFVV